MAENAATLPTDVETLQLLVSDLSRRLANAQHTIDVHKRVSKNCIASAERYRQDVNKLSTTLRREMSRNESWQRKKTKEDEATRYDSDKKKGATLHEELRLAVIDQQISSNKTTVRRVNKLKSQLEVIEAQQGSLKRSINHLVTMEQMTEELSQSAQLGDLQKCAFLIQRGAFAFPASSSFVLQLFPHFISVYLQYSVNEPDSAGFLPLHYACRSGALTVVRLLCEYGSDVTCITTGQSAVEIAARNGHSEVIRILVDFGVNIDERGSSGCPALVAAAQSGHFDCLNTVLSLGADVNIIDAMTFNTALHMAVKHMEPPGLTISLIKLLLSFGADATKKNQEGHTPLQVALSVGNFTAVTALGGRSSSAII